MPDLIPPHGGVSVPVNRTVADLGGAVRQDDRPE